MHPELKEALEALSDFRQFWADNVTQTVLGAGHHNWMWTRIAMILDKHGMNNKIGTLHKDRYYQFDPDYVPATRTRTTTC